MKTNKRYKREYNLEPEQVTTMQLFLEGEMTCREAGARIGVSHEQIIHLATSLTIQWIKDGKLSFSKEFLNRAPLLPKN